MKHSDLSNSDSLYIVAYFSDANWQLGFLPFTIVHIFEFMRARSRSHMYACAFWQIHTLTHVHLLLQCKLYTKNTVSTSDVRVVQATNSWLWRVVLARYHCITYTYFYAYVCMTRCIYTPKHLHIYTYTQQLCVAYVRARHKQKQNAKHGADDAVTTGHGNGHVVQKGRVSCWGLKREQRPLLQYTSVACMYTIFTGTYMYVCTYIYTYLSINIYP